MVCVGFGAICGFRIPLGGLGMSPPQVRRSTVSEINMLEKSNFFFGG